MKVTSDKEREIVMPPFQKSHEKEMEREIVKMVQTISRMYNNQVIESFNQSTVNKFTDAQAGNYARVLIDMSKRVKRKLLDRYDDKRIKKITHSILSKTRNANAKALYSQVENVSGIPVKTLMMNEGLNPKFNALYIETEEWIKKLRDDHLIAINNNTLRMMTEGKSIPDIVDNLVKSGAVAESKAGLVARQQVASFNGLATKIRGQSLGITEAIWKTGRDERVRASHADREGKRFNLKDGLYSSLDGKHLHAGTDFNCRCRAKLIIPEDK